GCFCPTERAKARLLDARPTRAYKQAVALMLRKRPSMSPTRKLSLFGVGLLVSLAVGPRAAHATESAQDFVQSKQATVTTLLHQSPSSQRDKQISAVLDGMMDYDELAKRSLASHWNDLS